MPASLKSQANDSTHTPCVLPPAILLLSATSFAQNAFSVKGRVVDYDTKQPLRNISITLSQIKNGTGTNDSGNITLPVPVLQFTLVIPSVGYVHINHDGTCRRIKSHCILS